MRELDDGGDGRKLVAAASAFALCFGLFMGLVIMAAQGPVILAFLMLSVFPALLGYAGLSRGDHLPWQGEGGEDEDLLAELKRRYATGDIEDDDLERKVETLLSADEAAGGRRRERERARR